MNVDEESHLEVFGRKEVPSISLKAERLMTLLAQHAHVEQLYSTFALHHTYKATSVRLVTGL